MRFSPDSHRPPRGRTAAFTLDELLVLVVVLIILAGLFLPRRHYYNGAMRIKCVNNLKEVGLAFRIWAEDNHDKFPMQISVTNGGTLELAAGADTFPHFQVMSNDLYDPRILVCPQDVRRRSATNFVEGFNDDSISYFVGVNAEQTNPSAVLAGDRNLAVGGMWLRHGLNEVTNNAAIGWTRQIHSHCGNIALADGSVQQVDSDQLRWLFERSGAATNRLVLP
jgi:hypothetical protein